MAVRPIEAQAILHEPRERVFAYLSRLENHWGLADRWIEVVSLESRTANPGFDRATVRVRGPLGMRRTARTRVLDAEPPGAIAGTADFGRTRARVTWTLEDAERGTHVRLAAEVEEAAPRDQLLLALGGRIWMRARFRGALGRLESLLREAGGD